MLTRSYNVFGHFRVRSYWNGWVFCQVFACCFASVAMAQTPLRQSPPANAPSAIGKGVDRTSLRPSIPAPSVSTAKLDKPEKVKGITGVGIEPGLERILRGHEPQNQAELIALQNQQAKVAEKVNLVTVNLQHGSTQGSGVIITGSGYILTAAHVAGRPKQPINITLHDGRRVKGETMGVNRNVDAGLVRILSQDPPVDPWPHATLGSSADLQLGQWCIATGHPGGWMPDRPAVVRVGRLLKVVQSTLITDCSLIGGDSGGPLFNLEGKLIGIHSRIGVDVDDNMHVPVDMFHESWERLVKNEAWGTLPGFKPVIGVRGTEDPASSNVCKIAAVDDNSPASRAGIQKGDVILKFDNQVTKNFDDLKEAVDSVTPGEQIIIELERNGRQMTVRLVVGVKEQ